MAKEYRETTVKMLLEAHLDQLKKINEGIQSILVVQKGMKKELEGMRPIKEEWPIVKKAIVETKGQLNRVENKIDTLDKQVSLVLPDHDKRLVRLESKLA